VSSETIPDHLVITPPDRYHGEGPKILWVDWQFDQIEHCLNMLRGSPIRLIFYTYGPNDSDAKWLLDTAYQADIILMNMDASSGASVLKGHMISWDKTFYFGRKDLQDIFPGYIDDHVGKMLVWVGEEVHKRNT